MHKGHGMRAPPNKAISRRACRQPVLPITSTALTPASQVCWQPRPPTPLAHGLVKQVESGPLDARRSTPSHVHALGKRQWGCQKQAPLLRTYGCLATELRYARHRPVNFPAPVRLPTDPRPKPTPATSRHATGVSLHLIASSPTPVQQRLVG
jgi:hypothetical protein